MQALGLAVLHPACLLALVDDVAGVGVGYAGGEVAVVDAEVFAWAR